MPPLNKAQRVIAGIVIGGAVVIAGIGFAGSYAAVRELAIRKGFGQFAHVFPLGIDAGILVLLALDLLLTWLRMPFPLLRQTAWLLTAATIAFNAAAAWPDPLGVAMHGVIPVLFVVAVEAARHAVGRIAKITAGRYMEPVRVVRWLLSPAPTFLLWRRMQLWEIRSYDDAIGREIERLVYRARLRARFGRAWRRKAPVEMLLPLRLTRYGVRLSAARERTVQQDDGAVLDAYVQSALEVASPHVSDDGAGERAAASVKGDSDGGVNAAADGQPVALPVNAADAREQERVNRGVKDPAVNAAPPIHASAEDPVNGSWKQGSGTSVKPADDVNSRLRDVHAYAFTPSAHPGRVSDPDRVNGQVTVPVNVSRGDAGWREFTREPQAVNRGGWAVNGQLASRVNSAFTLAQGAVNDEFARDSRVNSGTGPEGRGSDDSVNGEPRESGTPRVNDEFARDSRVNSGTGPEGRGSDDSVNGEPRESGTPRVNEKRRSRTYARRRRTSARATVDPERQRERAEAVTEWRLAKAANPYLTQKDFAESKGRSPAWLTKALQEAVDAAEPEGSTRDDRAQ
ncbi:DUF2637 domain-containing protein (plasmid) [Streptomyces sp. NBC_00637]|uniref:DUF2637 domain-containing protein n=1 Tax=Streptomyces sp. NBC_00637 TaxID=2903667 RepID=UPI002F913A5E